MTQHRDTNRRLWNEWAVVHERSDFYDVESFKNGRNTLSQHEFTELGDVSGKRLLHLMCHIGLDTMSLARMGASVLGVDFSSTSVQLARGLAREVGLPATFVESDVYDIEEELDAEEFDIVYTSHGVLAWLPDLGEWARLIAWLLKPGGFFYISEIHPLSHIFAETHGALTVTYPYFGNGATEWENQGSYAVPQAEFETQTKFQWQHTLSEVINSIVGAGLKIEFLREYPATVFQQFSAMELNEDNMWCLPGSDLPFLFTLRAHKRLP